MLSLDLKNKLTMLAILTIFAAGAAGHHYLYQSRSENYPSDSTQETELANQDLKIKITNGTQITQKIIYLKCNDEEIFRSKPSANLIGITQQQLLKIYPGWTIDKFDVNEVEMVLKVDSYCRDHANHMFLGIKDGYVAVYYGKPGTKAILKEVTTIPLNRLMPQDVDELKRGLQVQNREELLRTLEGLQSK